ncbi:glutathione peroxidase [Brachybacterium sp. AOP25-B2-12]|uniref:glutathione peroxidase n=1 Tax=Brachybacterium sp. AOP25-B2-12 TaxID=3457710 RepID=UPI004034920E
MEDTAPAPPRPFAGPVPPQSASPSAPTSLYDFSARTITGVDQDLAAYRGTVTLVVNTASRCAFRRQYEDLQQLQLLYGDRGFTVLAFPCDQFLHQEPGTDAEIEELCRTSYDVTFPMFSKVDVNGPAAHPVFRWLRGEKGGIVGGRIAWNFTKFLVGPDGQVIRRYAPPIPPLRIARRIEQALENGPAIP